MSIFVQIASYRDPQLIPTLTDLVAKAKFPDELKICVCWQHDDKEDISKFKDDNRFIFLDVPYEKSLGTCWAVI